MFWRYYRMMTRIKKDPEARSYSDEAMRLPGASDQTDKIVELFADRFRIPTARRCGPQPAFQPRARRGPATTAGRRRVIIITRSHTAPCAQCAGWQKRSANSALIISQTFAPLVMSGLSKSAWSVDQSGGPVSIQTFLDVRGRIVADG